MHGRAPVALAVVAALMTGCTSSAPDGGGSSAPETVSPAVGGQPENVHRFGDRVRVAVDGAAARITVGKPCATEPRVPGRPNRNRFAVRVTVAGLSGTFDVDPRDFSALDSAGDTLDAD